MKDRHIPFGFQGTGKALAGEGEGVYTEYMTEPESHEQHSQNLKGEGYILVVVPAAGIGRRMQLELPKQYLLLRGKTILQHTLEKLLSYPRTHRLIVVLAPDDPYWSTLPLSLRNAVTVVTGGAERSQSVYQGLLACQPSPDSGDWVLVHDAVRPCVAHADIDRLYAAVREHPVGGLLALEVRDTLKRSDASQQVLETIDRHGLWQAQTPQLFRFSKLKRALEIANASMPCHHPTDESSALEYIHERPLLVPGNIANIKLTYSEDLLYLQQFL